MLVNGVSYQNNYVRHTNAAMRVDPIAKVSKVISKRANAIYDYVSISPEAYLNYASKANKLTNTNKVNAINNNQTNATRQDAVINAYQQKQSCLSDGLSGTIISMYI